MSTSTSTNAAQLKKLIKESIREVLAENDTIKMIISEAVKTAIITVLTEVKRDETATTVNEQKTKQTLTKFQRPVVDNRPVNKNITSKNPNGPAVINFMDVLKNEMNSIDDFSDDPLLTEIKGNRNPGVGLLPPDTESDDLELVKMLGLK